MAVDQASSTILLAFLAGLGVFAAWIALVVRSDAMRAGVGPGARAVPRPLVEQPTAPRDMAPVPKQPERADRVRAPRLPTRAPRLRVAVGAAAFLVAVWAVTSVRSSRH
jgi:hypothetical protein